MFLACLRQTGDPGLNYRTVTRVYQRIRETIYPVCELEGSRLAGGIEIDEAYFGGKRGRGAVGKRIVLGLLERNGQVYTRVAVPTGSPRFREGGAGRQVESLTAQEFMEYISKKTRKGSVYYTDTFRSYRSLKHLGKHHTISHGKKFPKTKNHINGIEGFGSYAKHVLYNYRGGSKYHFPMYLKEIEYRFNHRNENMLKLFVNIYFGYVPT